ncbi:MAG: 3-ketoacyl-ACP reductase [Verrucomicrobiota bacterium]
MKKTALITGGTRGIGLGIARQLENEGWALALNGVRPEEEVGDVLDSFEKSRPLYCQGDISDSGSHQAMIDRVIAHHGQLNLLVSNAGIAPLVRADLLEMGEESYDRVMDINLKGSFFLTQKVARYFVRRKEKDAGFAACIVNVSSISATVVSVNRGEYCMSKAAFSMSTQLFAARLGELGIPVYEIRPGVTHTDMTSRVQDKYDRLIADGLCVQQRWGKPEESGLAVAALARGDFPYSTGQVIMIDGGLTINRL